MPAFQRGFCTIASIFVTLLCGSCGAGPQPVGETATAVKSSSGSYIAWNEHIVDTEESAGGVLLRGAGRMVVVDLDNDGHDDILAIHQESGHLRVAFGSENSGDWFRLSLAEGEEVPSPQDLAADDLSGDGFPDVVVATAGHLLYLQNSGNPARGLRWERVFALSSRGLAPFRRVAVTDWNRDGKLDVVAVHDGRDLEENTSGGVATVVSWFELPANPLEEEGWQRHELAVAEATAYTHLVDLDGDGLLDVFATPQGAAELFWLRNPGDGSAMERYAIRTNDVQPTETAARLDGSRAVFADLSGDKRLDVILAGDSHALVWLEQPPEVTGGWKLHRIGTIAPDLLGGIAVADINGDGRDDVMAGGRGEPAEEEEAPNLDLSVPAGRLAWFEQPADSSSEWARHDIARFKTARFEFFAARDLDSDEDVDFLLARCGSDSKDGVYLLEQLHSSYAVDVFKPVREIEGDQLPLP